VGADIRIVQGDVRAVYDEMRERRLGRGWIIIGGDLVGQFDDAGLLDRVILGVCPVTLGAERPCFRAGSRRSGCASRRSGSSPVGPARLGPGAEGMRHPRVLSVAPSSSGVSV
jgi:dihydrofolate reductase